MSADPDLPRARSAAGAGMVALVIFSSRWLQAPIYLGLIVVQLVFAAQFFREAWHLVSHFPELGEREVMLAVLGLVDVVMISNLMVVVIVGGWETFVSRLNLGGHPDQPDWLGHVNPGILKVKLASAIIGISAVHLLHTFLEADMIGLAGAVVTWQAALVQTAMHLVFIASALGLAAVDRIGGRAP